ncbi:hypothetical protein JB92DRAFT_2723188, partial [Gautieria morchelliformis]
FTNLTDHDLELLLRLFKQCRPESDLHYIIGFMQHHGLRIQKEHVRGSYGHVNLLGGRALQRNKKIECCKHTVPWPNFVWHCIGHHKPIWWGIVIHGFIDGFCRTVGPNTYACSRLLC